ncbi:Inactive protein kinase [Cucurbita argyrosperma subsp. argyrosperma]|nr:Inactive protein kinase [Cucurbita argyrosperma subsp. argyrosperma]
MSRESKRGKQDKGSDDAQKVIVAVKASKEIPKTALVWALTHVVQIGDCITLLVVVPSQSSAHSGTSSELKCDITDSCSQMILQLHDVYDPNKINVKIKIVSASPNGAVAAEAKRAQASWVVLDKHLKHEEKCCMEELQCNIVVMKRSQPKVLRLNLVGSPKKEPDMPSPLPYDIDDGSESNRKENDPLDFIRGPVVTPNSSPELDTPFTATEAGTSSVSSSDPGTSPFFVSEMNGDTKKEELFVIKENKELDAASSDSDIENLSVSSRSLRFQPWMSELLSSHLQSSQHIGRPQRCDDRNQMSTRKSSKLDRESSIGMSSHISDNDFHGDVRDAVSLSRNTPPGPPPLCSICQHKAPVFGKPPRWFSYAELELATGGFSQANFLAEGGYGSVHRGVLPDGQVVAVKQHKLASSQGDHEFCSEVEVLSCAQHRNVVLLIGFCIEEKRRLLVYEYICNGSLDSHLYGRQQEPLEWSARQKVAVGAARGLRYLHEECRVGCIVHRDMRPNNILITHDFEPLPDGDTGVETRVIGTFGYLAPEYAQSGQITEKADVYSFGVVLVELITGRKAVDLNRPKGQQCLTEWARPLLDEFLIDELIDPRLGNSFAENEVYCMLHAASLCIRRDPNARPRMSQVLRILEGDLIMDANYLSTPGYDVGNRSGRMWTEQQQQNYSGSLSDETLERFNEKVCLESLRSGGYWERDKTRRSSSGSNL